jgi:ParB family transcriptional regulator, chromosome partitioning protein
MVDVLDETKIAEVPLCEIDVPNPRKRKRKEFAELTRNISQVGLKRPITINASDKNKLGFGYELVCGEGRLSAYKLLGCKTIPAIILNISKEEQLIRGLVENIARRTPASHELLRDVFQMAKRGHACRHIARTVGLSEAYVRNIQRLLKKGEKKLIESVYKGQVPISTAMIIARTKTSGTQDALVSLYKKGALTSRELKIARQLAEQRLDRENGGQPNWRLTRRKLTTKAMVKYYQEETQRQLQLIQRAEIAKDNLDILVGGMRVLFADGGFKKTLKSEGVDRVPVPLYWLFGPDRADKR